MGYSALPEDYLYMNREVVAGSGQVDLSAPGVWYLRVHLLTPAPEELRAKCRQFMYNATLTLNVGERQKTEAPPGPRPRYLRAWPREGGGL